MAIQIGCMVKSKCGRDKNRYYVVVGFLENCPLIADGKIRKIEQPKQKNIKHLENTTIKFSVMKTTTNRQLKRDLFQYNYGSLGPSPNNGEVVSCQNKML